VDLAPRLILGCRDAVLLRQAQYPLQLGTALRMSPSTVAIRALILPYSWLTR
jgi:hypothetical protein